MDNSFCGNILPPSSYIVYLFIYLFNWINWEWKDKRVMTWILIKGKSISKQRRMKNKIISVFVEVILIKSKKKRNEVYVFISTNLYYNWYVELFDCVICVKKVIKFILMIID